MPSEGASLSSGKQLVSGKPTCATGQCQAFLMGPSPRAPMVSRPFLGLRAQDQRTNVD